MKGKGSGCGIRGQRGSRARRWSIRNGENRSLYSLTPTITKDITVGWEGRRLSLKRSSRGKGDTSSDSTSRTICTAKVRRKRMRTYETRRMELLLALSTLGLWQLVVDRRDGGHADGTFVHSLDALIHTSLPLQDSIHESSILNEVRGEKD